MFKRLDANKDGAVTADEIPAGAPERLKQLLTKADKDGDRKITPDELKAAFKARREAGQRGPRPDGRPSAERQSRSAPPPRGGAAGPATALRRSFQQGFQANLPELPDLQVLFDRFDTDKDGKLSFDEFKTGATKVHRYFAQQTAANPAPVRGFAGGRDAMAPPWAAMRQTGWERPIPPGAHFGQHGPGWQRGPGPQFHGYAYGWQGGAPPMRGGNWHGGPGFGPKFGGYAYGGHPGPGPQFRGPRPGHGPQFRGYAMNQWPGRPQQFHGEQGMGRGPWSHRSDPNDWDRPRRDRDGGGPHPERAELE
jgi:hypothetical protein